MKHTFVVLLFAALIAGVFCQRQEFENLVPEQYLPQYQPGYAPRCTESLTNGYKMQCISNSSNGQCDWIYETNCSKTSAGQSCPWNYAISCTTFGTQVCKWNYKMNCAKNSSKCPWTYGISCV